MAVNMAHKSGLRVDMGKNCFTVGMVRHCNCEDVAQ